MDVQIPCICPPKDGEQRHEHDTVTLPDRLPFRQLLAIRHNLAASLQAPGVTQGDVVAALIENYVLATPTAWSVVDEKGLPLPLSRAELADRLLANYDAAEAVGDAADQLYSDVVTLPLQDRASTSSPPTPTPGPTSPTTAGSRTPKPRKGSKPSSISTTPMAVTGPMAASPAGGSSYSQS